MVTLFGKRIRIFRPRSIWLRKVVQAAFVEIRRLMEIGAGLLDLSIRQV